jgi:hypothetical protein
MSGRICTLDNETKAMLLSSVFCLSLIPLILLIGPDYYHSANFTATAVRSVSWGENTITIWDNGVNLRCNSSVIFTPGTSYHVVAEQHCTKFALYYVNDPWCIISMEIVK